MLSAVGFAALAVVDGVAYVTAKKSAISVLARGGDEADALSVAPPSYREKDEDVEAEGEWDEGMRGGI